MELDLYSSVLVHIDFFARRAYDDCGLGSLDKGMWRQTGRPTEADAEFRRALEISAKLAGDHPAVAKYRFRLAASHINGGGGLMEAGKPSEAEAAYRRGLEILQKLADDNPAVTEFRRGLAHGHLSLADLMAFPRGPFPSMNMLKAWGKPTEAEAELRRAVEIWEKLADDNPAVTDFRLYLAGNHSQLGLLLDQMDRPTEAEAECRRAVPIYEKLARITVTTDGRAPDEIAADVAAQIAGSPP